MAKVIKQKKKSNTTMGILLLISLALIGTLLNRLNSGPESIATYTGTGPDSAPTEVLPAPTATIKPGETLKAPPGAKVGEWVGDNKNRFNNAAIIITEGMNYKANFGKDVPCRGWIVAIGTSLQESGLVNLGDLGKKNDHDSLGLFQQRPSQGWGTPEQVKDPVYASRKFYQKLTSSRVAGWESMRLADAAQAVQNSAYPDYYQKRRNDAIDIVHLILNYNGVSTATCPSKSNLQGL